MPATHSLYELKDSLGHLATQFSKAALRRISHELQAGGYPITSEQWTALVHVWNREGLTQRQLGALLLKDKTNVARLLAGLEAAGYILRQPGHPDRREKLVRLTDTGRAAMPGVAALVQKMLDAASAGIDPVELDICRRVLRAARLNLEEPGPK